MACTWRIRHKLLLGLGLVLGILALLVAGTWKGLSSFRNTMRLMDSKLVELNEAERLRERVKALYEPSHDPANGLLDLRAKMRTAFDALQEYKDRLLEGVNYLRDPHHGFIERGQVQALEERFQILQKRLAEAERPVAGSNASSTILDGNIKAAVEDLIRTSNDLNEVIYKELHDRINVSKTDYKISLGIVLPTLIGGVVLMLGFLRFFYRWVFYPIRDLQQGVSRVAKGDFDQRIEVHSGDEIEDLAKAYNDMTGRLRDMYTNLAQQVNDRSRQLVRSERLAGVGFLAAGVAHEINNPLAGIAFCSEALERRLGELFQDRPDVTEEDRDILAKYLKMIQDEAFRCKEITQRLLEFSRGGDRRREPTDLTTLLQSVLDMVQHLPNSRGKEVAFYPSGSVTAWVNGQEIKSVVLNLVVNALDSMDEGGKLTISQRDNHGMAELVFQDTGCGMTAEVLENIFEPFFTRSRTGKGTGLGLSISHRIINAHGGEIEATSAGPGQGSTFTVRLPTTPVNVQGEGIWEQGDEDQEAELGALGTRRAERKAA